MIGFDIEDFQEVFSQIQRVDQILVTAGPNPLLVNLIQTDMFLCRRSGMVIIDPHRLIFEKLFERALWLCQDYRNI